MTNKNPVTYSTVGLDLSLSGTGIAIATGPSIELLTIKTKPKDFDNDLERLFYIVDTVMNNIPEKVPLICVEDYFVPQNRMQAGSAVKLIGLGVLVRKALYEANKPFIVVGQSSMKKFVTGKGNCAKNMVLREVYKRWGVEAKDDNQADAFGLAMMADATLRYRDGERSFPKYQLEAIVKTITGSPAYNFDPKSTTP